MRLLSVLALVLLVGCGRNPENAAADFRVLCDPATGQAFFVRPGGGDISFIRPINQEINVCKKDHP